MWSRFIISRDNKNCKKGKIDGFMEKLNVSIFSVNRFSFFAVSSFSNFLYVRKLCQMNAQMNLCYREFLYSINEVRCKIIIYFNNKN